MARIDVEKEFDGFIQSFREGHRVDHLLETIPHGALNADYFFKHDNVIAELKCLFSDPVDTGTYGRRLVESYKHFGYSDGEIGSFIMGMREPPDKVKRRIFSLSSRPIVEAIKKANKQIRSTKALLGTEGAKGLVLVANDSNHGFSPRVAMHVISRAFAQLERPHIDGIVYLTPNVHHDDGTPILKTYWMPVYNVGSENFAEFVNPLGKAWFDYLEERQGPVEQRSQQDSASQRVLNSTPVRMTPDIARNIFPVR